ncbi:MAG: (Fe-S)-binding protein [Promethearchaeota archaeon]
MEIFKKFAKYTWMIDILKDMSKEDRSNFLDGYKKRKTYYTMENITANIKDLLACANCPNMCRFDCPTLDVTKRETYSPAKKAQLGYFGAMGHISLTDPSVQDALYACTTCDACREWCPMDISTGDLLVEMRQELEKRDLIPSRLHVLGDNADKSGTVFEESPFLADSEFNINMPNPEIFFYIGCMDIKHQPKTVSATISLLQHLKIPFCTHLEERQCCGGPIYKAGYRTKAAKIAEQNRTLVKASKAKLVITNCPGCFSALQKTYKELDLSLNIKVQHSVEFFLEKIRNGDLKPSKTINKTITFHDPCLVSRTSSVKSHVSDFRELFKAIPGITLKEVDLHGKETRCCGMGGGYAVSNPDNAMKLHVDRLQQLQEQNTDWIVSGCPTCEFALQKALNTQTAPTDDILDFIEILWKSVSP